MTDLHTIEIALPARTNDALKSYHLEHASFKDWLLTTVGGYTELSPADGAWRDNGRDYRDRMYCYRIALPLGADGTHQKADKLRKAIVDKAFALFHDQIAIFVQDVGPATIHRRK